VPAIEMKVGMSKEFLDTKSGIKIGDQLGLSSPISILVASALVKEVEVVMFAGAGQQSGRGWVSNDMDNCVCACPSCRS